MKIIRPKTKIKIPIANGIIDSFIINQFLEIPNFSPRIPIKPVRRILNSTTLSAKEKVQRIKNVQKKLKDTLDPETETQQQSRKGLEQLGLEEKRTALRNFRPQGFISEDNENEFTFLGKKFVSGKTFAEHTNLNERDMNEHIKWIKDAKRMANWVIMSFHCHESGEIPSDPPEFLVDFAHRCIDAGVDIFLGHGPHITRGVEIYKDKPIFYSLGNFIFKTTP